MSASNIVHNRRYPSCSATTSCPTIEALAASFLLLNHHPPIRNILDRPFSRLDKAVLIILAQQLTLDATRTVMALWTRIRHLLDQNPGAIDDAQHDRLFPGRNSQRREQPEQPAPQGQPPAQEQNWQERAPPSVGQQVTPRPDQVGQAQDRAEGQETEGQKRNSRDTWHRIARNTPISNEEPRTPIHRHRESKPHSSPPRLYGHLPKFPTRSNVVTQDCMFL